eukprot:COSAG06_NODE_10483_length_1674_cov_1.166984_1_plen_249_part_00
MHHDAYAPSKNLNDAPPTAATRSYDHRLHDVADGSEEPCPLPPRPRRARSRRLERQRGAQALARQTFLAATGRRGAADGCTQLPPTAAMPAQTLVRLVRRVETRHGDRDLPLNIDGLALSSKSSSGQGDSGNLSVVASSPAAAVNQINVERPRRVTVCLRVQGRVATRYQLSITKGTSIPRQLDRRKDHMQQRSVASRGLDPANHFIAKRCVAFTPRLGPLSHSIGDAKLRRRPIKKKTLAKKVDLFG